MTRLYAALGDRILAIASEPGRPESDDPSGTSWSITEGLVGKRIECLAAAPSAPDLVLCGTFESGVWRSVDGGDSWQASGGETVPASVTAVAVDPTDAETVWLGTEPSDVYRSTDGGVTWERRPGLTDLPSASGWAFPPRPSTHHVRWIEVDPADPEHLYVAVEAGALVGTHDAGSTWEDRQAGSRRDTHTMATHADAPGLVYAAAGDGFAVSTDAGETWAHPQTGLDHRYCWSVAVDPGDPEIVALSAASGARTAHGTDAAESYVYRRTGDGGWERAMAGLPDPDGLQRGVLDAGREPGRFYALTNRGLFGSTDAAETWTGLDVIDRKAIPDRAPRGLAVVE